MSVSAQLVPIVKAHAATRFVLGAKAMEELLDAKVPFDTGLLKHSQTAAVNVGAIVMSVTLSYPLDYGEYHDRGMPSTIKPKRGKFLVFAGDRGTVYAKVVHPTQKHKGWFTLTVRTWPAVIGRFFG